MAQNDRNTETPVTEDAPRAPKPNKTLPTTRIAFAKQIEILRAYGAAYALNSRAVTTNDIAKSVGMAASTVPLANAFFLEVGAIQRTDVGYVPHADVISFHRAFEFGEENPAHRMQHLVRSTWFAQALLGRLAFKVTMDESD